MSEHAELIARLEVAEGPSRDLDMEIAKLAQGFGLPGSGLLGYLPYFTSSLDAALTLVPKGMWWLIGLGKTRPKEPLYGAQILLHGPRPPYNADVLAEGEHDANPAIALCIASLKARSAKP
jgi:hypothetical protein